MAIVKSPAFMLEDAHSPPAALLPPYGRTTSVGNATAAQLHAPTPAAPVKFTLGAAATPFSQHGGAPTTLCLSEADAQNSRRFIPAIAPFSSLSGRVYDDTSKFDDLPMLDAPNSWRIAGIAVWGGSVVNGIRITYERGGVLRSSRELVGYDDGPHEWEQIELRPGEEIIKIEAVISFRIEKLTFRTSQSRHGTFGRGTEGQVHELSVPSVRRETYTQSRVLPTSVLVSDWRGCDVAFAGAPSLTPARPPFPSPPPRNATQEHRLVAFHGGVGGSLHTFGFWTLPLPTSFLSKDETPPGAGIPLLVRSLFLRRWRICAFAIAYARVFGVLLIRPSDEVVCWVCLSLPAGSAREARVHRRGQGWDRRAHTDPAAGGEGVQVHHPIEGAAFARRVLMKG